MATFKCNSCDGEFTDPLPDGYRYFHACAPVTVHKAQHIDGTIEDDVRHPAPTDTVLETRTISRADYRDENVHIVPDAKGQPLVTVKAEGKGRTELGA
jgi:hypothetical protein